MSAESTKRNQGVRRVAEAAGRGMRAVVAYARRYWRAALLLVVFSVLVLGPGYTANQPSFYERFEGLGAYQATWANSTHANVPCQSCHVDPGPVAQSIYAVRMAGEAYLALLPALREPATLSTPPTAACNRCHVDLRSVSPAGDLLIPHTAHVDALGVDCIVCHVGELVHNADPAISTTPRMATCLTCHDGQTADEACDACHTEKGIPANHQEPTFIVDHAERQSEIDCQSCHAWREDWCRECHERRPRSHGTGANPSEWRAAHRDVVAARAPRNCEACHEDSFCIECHGELPPGNYDPAVELVR